MISAKTNHWVQWDRIEGVEFVIQSEPSLETKEISDQLVLIIVAW